MIRYITLSSTTSRILGRSWMKRARSTTTTKIPCRETQIQSLKSGTEEFDILIVGAGATGAGAALDARSRGLSVACVERGDFGNETSSRSTKLLWAGIRYLGTAIASLVSKELFTSPISTFRTFTGEIKLVLDAHRERRFLLETQPHLTNWVPIAVPIQKWFVWPPPLGHPLFSLVGITLPFVMKFYDSLSNFSCPGSHIISKKRASRLFPQLTREIKYAQVFYEGQHNDSRTALSIALTAAKEGAKIANYVEVVGLVRDDPKNPERVTGVRVIDRVDNDEFEIRAKSILFAGGPFTDDIRDLEQDKSSEPAVKGAAGTHVILPSYYCSQRIGLLDINTSDGRFLFFLPWMGHTLVGTTDTPGKPTSDPTPPESDIRWILSEVETYLDSSLRVRRSDVLSAWRGFRPLATDPHAPPGAPVSREHVVSRNPKTGVFFVVGGKWTTYRSMAEDAINRVLEMTNIPTSSPSRTLTMPLIGAEGYTNTLSLKLAQRFGISESCAEHLARTYGTNAIDVCNLLPRTSSPADHMDMLTKQQLVSNFPYLEVEIQYAIKCEYVRTIRDFVSLRTRLAYLNVAAAEAVIPRVSKVMAKELSWNDQERFAQMADASEFVNSFGGPVPNVLSRSGSRRVDNAREIFRAIDINRDGKLEIDEIALALRALGVSSPKSVRDAFAQMDKDSSGCINEDEFEAWWSEAPESSDIKKELGVKAMLTFEKVGKSRGVMFG